MAGRTINRGGQLPLLLACNVAHHVRDPHLVVPALAGVAEGELGAGDGAQVISFESGC